MRTLRAGRKKAPIPAPNSWERRANSLLSALRAGFCPKQVLMDWTRALVVLLVLIQPCLAVSLTVEAEQNWYRSEFGGDVVMGCRFQAGVPPSNLTVTWHWISGTSPREAYRLENGLEHPDTQDPVYRDRAALLREELKDGWAKLKISELRIGDSGTYQCLVRAGIEADYKEIHLRVTAPYKTVTKHLQRVEGGDEALLTCQSEGLPKSSVQWLDGHGRPLNASTTATVTPQQLVRVASQIQVRFHDDSNYTCSFDGGGSATFILRDEPRAPPPANTKAPFIAVGVVVGAVLVMTVFLWQRRKGQRFKKKSDEEQRIYEGPAEDAQRTLWGPPDPGPEERLRVHRFVADALPPRLRDSRGQPVGLQALLPGPGQTLFLEGPPGSGKTSVAQLLAFPCSSGPSYVDLSGVRLLVLLDCNKVKGHLLQEITRLLPASERWTEEELRAALAQSGEVLLLLDGYREGQQDFDQSLHRFLQERSGCRVLISACPGQCCTLKDACAGAAVLQLDCPN